MISILMPIYNGEEFFPESIATIFKQTWTDWELLIGVNGHPANGPFFQSLQKYVSKKVHIFDLPTVSSKSEALNFLVKYSRMDYIALLDVDDLWNELKLETQMRFKFEYDVVGTNTDYFGERTDRPNIPLGQIDPSVFKTLNPIVNSSVILNRRDAEWDPTTEGIEDYDLWLKLRKRQKTFYNVPNLLTYHRIHQGSFFNNKNYDVEGLRKKYGL